MPTWKNALINLLNIAGTGPILGPIQGILFGPIALLTIPIGNVIGGAMHDYFAGMICTRDGGIQMPDMIKKYTNSKVFWIYDVFVSVLLLLVGAVFIYTPGDIAATQVFGFSGGAKDPTTWIIYGIIFVYYYIATVFPIDKIIGKVYPIFGVGAGLLCGRCLLCNGRKPLSACERLGQLEHRCVCVRRLLLRLGRYEVFRPLHADFLRDGCLRYPLGLPLDADRADCAHHEERARRAR